MKCCYSIFCKNSPLSWLTFLLFPNSDSGPSPTTDSTPTPALAMLEPSTMNQTGSEDRENHFEWLPTEMKFEVLKYLPLSSVLCMRATCHQWKLLCSHRLSAIGCAHLRNESYSAFNATSETFRTVRVSNWTLTENQRKIVSPTRGGIGPLILDAECLQVVGSDVEVDQLKRVLSYGKSIREVQMEACSANILIETVAVNPNTRLAHLSKIGIKLETSSQEIQSQIHFFNKLAQLAEKRLRTISHLSLVWTGHRFTGKQATIKLNFMAVMNLVGALRGSLKHLEIWRSPGIVLTLGMTLIRHVETGQVLQANQIRTRLQELKLDSLKINTFDARPDANHALLLENDLVRSQSVVKDLTLDKRVKAIRVGPQNIQGLLPPVTPTFPKCLENLELLWTVEGDTPINLGYFAQCPALKSLAIYCSCFMVGGTEERTCKLEEVNRLPRGLQSLRLIENRTGQRQRILHLAQSCILLTQCQVQWIVRNLRNLQYFGCLLLVRGQLEPEADAEVVNLRNRLGVVGDNQDFTALANVDMGLFAELLEMPKMKMLELNMLNNREILGFGLLLDDHFSNVNNTQGVAEYVSFSKAHQQVKKCEVVVNRMNYVELTISK